MSALAPARQPVRAAAAPLRLVPTVPFAAARLPFVLLIGGVLTAGLLTLLMLHTLAAQDGFRMHDLQRRAAGLADTEQQLAIAVEQAQSPAGLAAAAHKLGMVPAGSVAYIRLRDGRIVGVAHAASPPPAPPPATPSASAKPAAGHRAASGAAAGSTPTPTASRVGTGSGAATVAPTPSASAAGHTTTRTRTAHHRHR